MIYIKLPEIKLNKKNVKQKQIQLKTTIQITKFQYFYSKYEITWKNKE